MSALYDFFPTPQPKGSNKTRYHSRLVVKARITTEMMIEQIADRCSLSTGDLAAAFVEFAHTLEREIRKGNSVQLKGVGTFRGSAKSPAVRSPKEIRAENIHFGGIVFTPDKALEDSLKGMPFQRVAHTHRSKTISEIEIDGKLADYFQDHVYITTIDMCVLCGLRKSTALRRLQTRVKEGRLTHPGYSKAPFYYPVPGYFRVSRHTEPGTSV